MVDGSVCGSCGFGAGRSRNPNHEFGCMVFVMWELGCGCGSFVVVFSNVEAVWGGGFQGHRGARNRGESHRAGRAWGKGWLLARAIHIPFASRQARKLLVHGVHEVNVDHARLVQSRKIHGFA
jgi:hypothetical protein